LQISRERIEAQKLHLKYYVSHLIRTYHSNKAKANIFANLGPTQVAVTADYKMKFLQDQFERPNKIGLAKLA
jgi:hypothetical protein